MTFYELDEPGSIAGLTPVFLTAAGLCALAAVLCATQVTAASIFEADRQR